MKSLPFVKSYGKHTALRMPELKFTPGKIYAVVGANGSGKSTLAKVLADTLKSDSGERVLPKNIDVGYMPQRSFAFRMSVEKNIRLGGSDPERADQLTQVLGISGLMQRRAKDLSGGETAKLSLTRVLMKRYDLLVLDEPTASMDIRSALCAEALIREECTSSGCAVLLITHSITQARRMAHECIFLDNGEVAEWGSAGQVLYTPQDPRTQEFLRFFGGGE